MPRVLIVQSQVKRYRVPFFTGLHASLQKDGIDLIVAYSPPNRTHATRQDEGDLPGEMQFKVKGHWIFDRAIYQHVWREVWPADLVIVGPESKFLINPALLSLSALRLKRVAFWGLGPNNHPDKFLISEVIKERLVTSVDWWFAYTPSIKTYLQRHGMPGERITNVQNATDTNKLRSLMNGISPQEAIAAKQHLTGMANSKIGFYCGLIGDIKAIPLLIDAARLVKRRCREFHLVLVGSGPDRPWLEQAIASEPWIHYLGPQYGRESALLYKIADVFLLAGTAGLAIVDSFAAGLPLIATELDTHPPEIAYLRNGENSLISAHTATGFAAAIARVFENPGLMQRLGQQALADGSKYTMEAMVENFSDGIKQCLDYYRIPRESKFAVKSLSSSSAVE